MPIHLRILPAVGLLFSGCCFYHTASKIQATAALPAPAPTLPAPEPTVRVRLSAGNPAFVSSKPGMTLSGGRFRLSAGPNQVVQVKWEGGLTLLSAGRAERAVADTLTAQPSEGGLVRVGDRSYRGQVLFYRSADGDLAVVNVLGVEEYVCGVVPCEIRASDARTAEAVKAQAVAARGFTLSRLGRRQGLGHDLFDSYLRDQEYRGVERETELARQAVQATQGEVLEFAGEVCEAMYHANCGGVTANGSRPYLRSVPDTPGQRRGAKAYCSARANFNWQLSVSKESLEAVVGRLCGKRHRVRDCRLETDPGSARVKYLHLTTDQGKLRLPGSDFRMAMGLKSTKFTLTLRGSTVVFTGHGWGHGVGMCQDGATAMAAGGADYREILRHYYPPARLRKRY